MRTRALTRRQTSFRLYGYLLDVLKKDAARRKSSLNSYVESILMESVEWEPNEDTLQAMDDIKNKRNLEPFNLDEFRRQYRKSK